jgi:hypothetical protein
MEELFKRLEELHNQGFDVNEELQQAAETCAHLPDPRKAKRLARPGGDTAQDHIDRLWRNAKALGFDDPIAAILPMRKAKPS